MTALGKLFRATAFRLTLAILGISAVGAAFVLGAVAYQVMALADQQTRANIETEAAQLSQVYDDSGVRNLGEMIEAKVRVPGSSLYLLTSPAGEPLAGNISALPISSLAKTGYVYTPYGTLDDDRPGHMALARVFVLPNGFRLLVGHDLGDRARIGAVMVKALAVSLIFFAILAGLCALFVARRVLSRIDAMSGSARAIMAGNLSARLPVGGSGDELDRLAASLNDMLTRNAALMTGLREVSDNIAHDLRTPLTRLRNQSEEALRGDQEPQALRSALERTIEESDHLMKIFDALLMIARAEAGGDRGHMAEFDLSAALEGVAELYEPLAEEKGLAITSDVAPGLRLVGNRELLGQAFANLIDNAVKYGAADGRTGEPIVLSARQQDGAVVVSIADRGPGIAAADRSHALDRFVRLEGSRSRPGSGLGLSIAAAVAKLHGGTVRLEDNDPGLRVTMSLPYEEPQIAVESRLLVHAPVNRQIAPG